MKCTWKGCYQGARHDHRGRTGQVWARLCTEHNVKFNAAIDSKDPKRIVGAWALAGWRMR